MFERFAVVIVGGALGSLARYLLSTWVEGYFQNRNFPAAILVCNVLGSLVIGILMGLMISKTEPNVLWRLFFIVGLCGGFTTFSSFSLDTINLLREGVVSMAIINIIASVGLCLLATYGGLLLTLKNT